MFKVKVVVGSVAVGLAAISFFNNNKKSLKQYCLFGDFKEALLNDLKKVIPSEQLNGRPDVQERYSHYEETIPYTAARKKQDIKRLEKMPTSNYMQELKKFQEPLFHVSVQSTSLAHDSLCLYMELPGSRMGRLEVLFQQGYFDLLHKLLKGNAQGNWLNIYNERRMPCILLAIQAGEKGLVSYLLQLECERGSNCLEDLVENAKELNLISEEDATNISAKILNRQGISEKDIINAIKWNELSAAERFSNSR